MYKQLDSVYCTLNNNASLPPEHLPGYSQAYSPYTMYNASLPTPLINLFLWWSPGEFNPEDFEEDDAIRTQPTADYQAVGETEPVTEKAPIALGPAPISATATPTTTGDGDTADKQAIPAVAPASGEEGQAEKKEEEAGAGQVGVVSVVVTEQESEEVGRGSDEQLIKVDED